jgi:hypothetical protein
MDHARSASIGSRQLKVGLDDVISLRVISVLRFLFDQRSEIYTSLEHLACWVNPVERVGD